MGCCSKGVKQKDLKFGADVERGCTDKLCLPIWILACLMQALVAWVAYNNGHPKKLIFGADYQGDLCGTKDPLDSPNLTLQSLPSGDDFSDYKYLWFPLDMSKFLGGGDVISGSQTVWTQAVANAVCVKKCPAKGDTIYTYGTGKDGKDPPSSYSVGYGSIPTLRRCLPTSLPVGVAVRESGALEMRMEPVRWNEREIDRNTQRGAMAPLAAVDRIASAEDQGFGAWLCTSPSALCVNVPKGTYGAVEDKSMCEEQCSVGGGVGGLAIGVATQTMADVYESLPVIGYAALLAVAVGVVWLLLMKHCAYVIICASLLIVFSAIGGIGYVLFAHAPASETPKYWIYAAYTVWGIDGVLMLFFLVFRKTIKIAAQVVMEGCGVMLSSLTTLFIPVATALFSTAFTLFCALVYVYISSMHKTNLPGEVEEGLGSLTNQSANIMGPVERWISEDPERTLRIMWWWNVFFYFWGTCFIADFAYMVMAIIGVFWYYSAPSEEYQKLHPETQEEFVEEDGTVERKIKEKETPGICRAICITLFHHMGTLAVGSFIVAVIKFIQFVFMKIKDQIESRLGKNTGRVVVCLIECVLWVIEKLVQAVTRRSYIITAINGEPFFPAAWESLSLMISNIVLVVATEFIEVATGIIGKLLITCCGVVFCLGAVDYWHMVPEGTGLWGPLIACGLASYAIGAIFIDVFETITNTILMTFMYDNSDDSDGDMYMPDSLKSTVGKIESHGTEEPKFKVGDKLKLRSPAEGVRLGGKGQKDNLDQDDEKMSTARFTVSATEPELELTYESTIGELTRPYLSQFNSGRMAHYAFMFDDGKEQGCRWYDPFLILFFPVRLVLCLLTCGVVPCLNPFGDDEDHDGNAPDGDAPGQYYDKQM